MSGTLRTLTPWGHGVSSPAGVIHWCGVPSLIHGVVPPCRCSVARLSLKHMVLFGSLAVHSGLRTPSITLDSSTGSDMAIGPMPEPMPVLSVGRKRSPAAPLGRRLRKTIRTGRSFWAAMTGPNHWGDVTPV